MKVRDIMHGIIKIHSSATVVEAAVVMDRKHIGSILVEENGKLIGIMTERDILRKIVARGEDPKRLTVKEIMSPDLITTDTNTDIGVASNIMKQNNIRRLVITENGEPIGIITTRDVSNNMSYLLAKGAAEYLPPY